jgi:hypothetical protein
MHAGCDYCCLRRKDANVGARGRYSREGKEGRAPFTYHNHKQSNLMFYIANLDCSLQSHATPSCSICSLLSLSRMVPLICSQYMSSTPREANLSKVGEKGKSQLLGYFYNSNT